VEIDRDSDCRHRAAEAAHEIVVAAARACSTPRAGDVQLEVDAGVVIQTANLPQVVDHVTPLARCERRVEREKVFETLARDWWRHPHRSFQRLAAADYERECRQRLRVSLGPSQSSAEAAAVLPVDPSPDIASERLVHGLEPRCQDTSVSK